MPPIGDDPRYLRKRLSLGRSTRAFNLYHRQSSLEGIQARLDSVRGPGSNRLVTHLTRIIEEGNAEDRMRALDVSSRPLVHWTVRKGKYRRWSWDQTLIPFGPQSDAIAGFFVRATRRLWIAGSIRIQAGIRSTKADIYYYHARGIKTKRGVIRRNILGLTNRVRGLVFAEIARWRDEGWRYR